MAIGTQDMEIIKREVAGIRDYYRSRMDTELPPLKEEVDRIGVQLGKIQQTWREGEKRAILAKYGGGDRLRVSYGKYSGLDLLDLACIRSLLTAQLREPSGLNPRMLEAWQANLKVAMDSTSAGSGDDSPYRRSARTGPAA